MVTTIDNNLSQDHSSSSNNCIEPCNRPSVSHDEVVNPDASIDGEHVSSATMDESTLDHTASCSPIWTGYRHSRSRSPSLTCYLSGRPDNHDVDTCLEETKTNRVEEKVEAREKIELVQDEQTRISELLQLDNKGNRDQHLCDNRVDGDDETQQRDSNNKGELVVIQRDQTCQQANKISSNSSTSEFNVLCRSSSSPSTIETPLSDIASTQPYSLHRSISTLPSTLSSSSTVQIIFGNIRSLKHLPRLRSSIIQFEPKQLSTCSIERFIVRIKSILCDQCLQTNSTSSNSSSDINGPIPRRNSTVNLIKLNLFRRRQQEQPPKGQRRRSSDPITIIQFSLDQLFGQLSFVDSIIECDQCHATLFNDIQHKRFKPLIFNQHELILNETVLVNLCSRVSHNLWFTFGIESSIINNDNDNNNIQLKMVEETHSPTTFVTTNNSSNRMGRFQHAMGCRYYHHPQKRPSSVNSSSSGNSDHTKESDPECITDSVGSDGGNTPSLIDDYGYGPGFVGRLRNKFMTMYSQDHHHASSNVNQNGQTTSAIKRCSTKSVETLSASYLINGTTNGTTDKSYLVPVDISTNINANVNTSTTRTNNGTNDGTLVCDERNEHLQSIVERQRRRRRRALSTGNVLDDDEFVELDNCAIEDGDHNMVEYATTTQNVTTNGGIVVDMIAIINGEQEQQHQYHHESNTTTTITTPDECKVSNENGGINSVDLILEEMNNNNNNSNKNFGKDTNRSNLDSNSSLLLENDDSGICDVLASSIGSSSTSNTIDEYIDRPNMNGYVPPTSTHHLISDSEMPQPDIVKTYKRLFESPDSNLINVATSNVSSPPSPSSQPPLPLSTLATVAVKSSPMESTITTTATNNIKCDDDQQSVTMKPIVPNRINRPTLRPSPTIPPRNGTIKPPITPRTISPRIHQSARVAASGSNSQGNSTLASYTPKESGPTFELGITKLADNGVNKQAINGETNMESLDSQLNIVPASQDDTISFSKSSTASDLLF
ncbi:hypothetical protein BLOT_001898 [Blomia tropicalis]|nr:hypothetical protein BLOT_001898 [Blomia tropicalis]